MIKTIKYVKYPNRRLYDTDISQYVPFNSLRKRIMDGYNIAVFNHKTEEDVTREVLISLILDQSMAGNELFSEDLMREIIKFYGHPMQELFKATLDQSHNMFASLWKTSASSRDKES